MTAGARPLFWGVTLNLRHPREVSVDASVLTFRVTLSKRFPMTRVTHSRG
ncbi:hypothetical protein VCR6J2_510026 [Vibrio coralliirubri]|nr:hypothetical protein VCR6J2_510026 [Vibrio coralliirubri]